ncbi:50S ribosomal protein L25 [Candidatus Collierbacteria bacterium CG10_big_fil_rev_8_21_14_0_10_44_9]|uniref:Large ribosomal subunit protein bL25 n=1 Tax=Candidatus Collierbacteria bacterium CG10_big_fil_rev_8_21_14_0_10_44_9 TaxID=1974535 RepID=A0A2H0VKU3_9BACT|nr:MAG: 50S ribosomal protein L25 [Candidatus Collierbacteria bacterium CG10_big_fil_rev_8_21_14_0_10_44_9]
MTTFELNANKRTIFGRKTKQLRKQGFVPANIFGKKIKSLAIQLEKSNLLDTMRKAGETGLIHLKIKGDDKTHPVLVSGYAQDPVTNQMLHVDFHEVDLKQKVTAMVPVKVVGESEATKAGLVLVMLKNELEVEALPTDLPDVIEVDVTQLTAVDDSIHAKDLKLDRSKVTLSVEDEEMIVTIQEPESEVVPETTEGEAATEGEIPAESGSDQTSSEPAEGQKPEDKKE